MSAQTHVIQRQILEVEVGDLSQSWAWQKQLSLFANGPLANRLADLFDQVADPEEVVRIDRLELSAELTSTNDWEGELLTQIEKQVNQSLPRNRSQGGQRPTFSRSGSFLSAFLFFVENGRLPWWMSSSKAVDFEKELLQHLTTVNELAGWVEKFKTATQSDSIRKRLVGQFSENTLQRLAVVVLKKSELEVADNQVLVDRFCQFSPAVQTWLLPIFWQRIFEKPELNGAYILAEIVSEKLGQISGIAKQIEKKLKAQGEPDLKTLAKKSPNRFLDFLLKKPGQDILKALADKLANSTISIENTSVNDANSRSTPSSTEPASAIFLRNAGMIILQPFLKAIFEKLSFAEQGKMLKPKHAISLLQYLATGREGDMEHELVLNKLLCGVPLDQPLERNVRLTKQEKTEAESLLKAVIEHWNALGNTSVDGLRGTFLCREGKFSQQPNQTWLLQVERQTVDILMDRLPWSFSLIKLPWMHETLIVDWL